MGVRRHVILRDIQRGDLRSLCFSLISTTAFKSKKDAIGGPNVMRGAIQKYIDVYSKT
jgi:hypothetical protein